MLMFLSFSDSKTETSKEICGFSEEDFQFQISNYSSLDGDEEQF
jgi:hypothetical protein